MNKSAERNYTGIDFSVSIIKTTKSDFSREKILQQLSETIWEGGIAFLPFIVYNEIQKNNNFNEFHTIKGKDYNNEYR